jgi:SAM-dependent methyltransferase
MSDVYTPAYFEDFKSLSQSSAEVIVPMVMDLVSPASVLDVGCGLGQWLAAFHRAGVHEILGLDGPYVEADQLQIPKSAFRVQDVTKPFGIDTKFDLAVCLEVAEHIPESNAAPLIQSLTNSAAVVLFGAAIPHQPGKDHINCQWPDYWADLFTRHQFVPIDALRHQIWDNSRVAWWYQQNIVLYVQESGLSRYQRLERFRQEGFGRPLRMVHPEMFDVFLNWGMDMSKRYWDLKERTRVS